MFSRSKQTANVCGFLSVSLLPLLTMESYCEKCYRTALRDQGANDKVAAIFSEFFDKHKLTLFTHLSSTGTVHITSIFTNIVMMRAGISAPSIVGIDWRLDYSVRSKHAGQENTAMFILCLKVHERNTNEIRNVEIVATQEEVQDMLSKVRDAVKQVERVVVASTASQSKV